MEVASKINKRLRGAGLIQQNRPEDDFAVVLDEGNHQKGAYNAFWSASH